MPTRFAAAALSAVIAAGLAGCTNANMDIDHEILVRKDGSGTATQTTVVPDMSAMMAMAGLPANPEAQKAKTQQALQMAKQQAKAAAEKIPDGRVSSVELLDETPARIRSVIAFDDVNQLDVAGVLGALGGSNTPDGAEKSLSMALADGVLTIANDSAKALTPEAMNEMLTPETKKMLSMVVPMLGESAIRVAVRAEGGFAETNARHVNAAGDRVTLMTIPLRPFVQTVIGKTEDFRKALAIEDETDRAKALEAMVDGLKIEANREVVIRFK